MTLTLLHTADVHVATFAALRDRIAPGTALRQEVRADWLAEARRDGVTDDLAARIARLVAEAPGPLICTCTTLGPAAEAAGAIRVDRPMMQAAGRIGGEILLVYALDSTAAASRDLLSEHVGDGAGIRPLSLSHLWPLFEAGDHAAFHAAIADAVNAAVQQRAPSCVVLAQASMAGAVAHLDELEVPVLTSPETALRAALAPAPTAS